MIKPTKRKAFSFLRSYFDALNEIPEKEDRYNFLISIIDKQFLDKDPINLTLITKLSYEGQRHSIEKSVKGYKDKMKTNLDGTPLKTPWQGSTQPPVKDPSQQEQEEEEEEEKGKLTINIDEDDVFVLKYLPKYKTYCNKLLKDSQFMEDINRLHKISMDKHICRNTIIKYLGLFLNQISISQEKHERIGKFNTHFSNWLRKQKIEIVKPKQKEQRYV